MEENSTPTEVDIAAQIEASETANVPISKSLLSNVPQEKRELNTESKEVAQRPEDWPEDLWDSERGVVKLDAIKDRLNKSDTAYKELRKVLSDKKSFESYKKEQEGIDLSKNGVPEKYEFDGIDDTYLEDKEALEYFSHAAREAGLNNDQANKVLSKFVSQQAEKLSQRRESELAKMGEDGKHLLEGIENFIESRVKRGTFTNEEAMSFANLITDASSAMAVSKLISMTGEMSIPSKMHMASHGRSLEAIRDSMVEAHKAKDETALKGLRSELESYYAQTKR